MGEESQAKQSALLDTVRSKFTPRTVLHVAQLVVIIALIVSTQNNQWTNINADFEYVELLGLAHHIENENNFYMFVDVLGFFLTLYDQPHLSQTDSIRKNLALFCKWNIII